MTWTQGITIGLALLGATLGVLNTWSQLSKNRVRLRVIPRIAFGIGDAKFLVSGLTQKAKEMLCSARPARLCIEVVNLSAFAVTIQDVGFGCVDVERHSLVQPELSRAKSWPVRLESREAITAYATVGVFGLKPEIVKNAKAYAKTDCGKVWYGSSPIFKAFVAELSMRNQDE